MGQDEKEKLQEQIKEEEVKPTEGTSSPVLDKTIKADLQESMQDIKPLSSERLDEVSRQLKDDKREFVEGGYAVDGYFVADDSLSRNEATTAAKKYYAGKYGDYADNLAPTSKHDAFQWKGKQYTTQTGTIASAPRYSSLPAIVKTSDYANYDALRAEKARLEAEAASMRPANESTEVSETPAPSPTPEPVPAPAETPAREELTAETPAPETNTSAPAATSTETPAEPVTPAAASVPETQEQAPVAETTPAAQTQTKAPETSTSVAEATQPVATTGATETAATTDTATTDTTETTGTSTDTTGDATGTADTTGDGTSTTGTGSEEDTDEGTQEEDLDIYGETIKYLEDATAKQKQQVNDIYQNEIGGYDKLYEEAMKRKEALATMDKERSKKENAYRYISGVGDLMSGFANLVGTANYASNQDQTYLAPELVKKAEAARKERRLEMQKLNARLEEMRARKNALATQRDTKLAELDAKLVSDVYKANMQKAQGEEREELQNLKGEIEQLKLQGKKDIEQAKIDAKIEVAEIQAASRLQKSLLNKGTTKNGRLAKQTFYDANGTAHILNVYEIKDVEKEIMNAVKANKNLWTEEEKKKYEEAVNKATLSSSFGGDGGRALDIFYEDMARKPYVYEHFKRLVGSGNPTTTSGSSVDRALEGL